MKRQGFSYTQIFQDIDGDTIPIYHKKDKRPYRISKKDLNRYLEERIEKLENNVYKATYFEVINISGTTTGSIAIPEGATVLEEEFEGRAVITQLNSEGYPNGEAALDNNGDPITANLATDGNWLSSGNYSQPVGLVYQLSILAKDFQNLNVDNLIDFYITDADKTFTYDQGVASTIWNVTHNLNKFPSATIVDSGGSVVEGCVDYIDKNNVTLTFSAAFTGKAHFN
jgi:hypothetical protein